MAFVGKERSEYRKKSELAKDQPEGYIALPINGAEQVEVLLHRFVTPTKDQCGQGLRIHLICVSGHAHVCHLLLFEMTKNNVTGSNHIVETIHRVRNDKERTVKLPQKLLTNLGNCSGEKKTTI